MDNRRKYGLILALAVVLLFIWGNSLLPANTSATISGWLHNSLKTVFHGDGSGGDRLLRKVAHFTEFALLGAVLFSLLKHRVQRIGIAWLLSLGCGVVAGGLDELLQHFSPGRGPRFGDVCIDAAGVLAGTLVYLMVFFIRKSKCNK